MTRVRVFRPAPQSFAATHGPYAPHALMTQSLGGGGAGVGGLGIGVGAAVGDGVGTGVQAGRVQMSEPTSSGHAAPPAPGCWVTLRARDWMPCPHDTLHGAYAPQVETWQLSSGGAVDVVIGAGVGIGVGLGDGGLGTICTQSWLPLSPAPRRRSLRDAGPKRKPCLQAQV